MKHIRIEAMVLALASAVVWGQAPEPTSAQVLVKGQRAEAAESAAPEEIAQDVVVRDKKGHLLKDLKAGDFKVLDDGTAQTLTGLRLVDGGAVVENGVRTPAESSQRIGLVTLVFERLDSGSGRIARDGAAHLIAEALPRNVYFSVLAIDTQLYVLQEFTNDRDALRKAIDKVTSGQYAAYAEDSNRIKGELRAKMGRPDVPAVEQRTARVLLEMLKFDSSFSRDEATRMSIFSLLSLVRGQIGEKGRKALIYFSKGMNLPPQLDVPFRNITGEANRGQVAIYAANAAGAGIDPMSQQSGQDMREALAAIAADTTSRGAPVSVEQIKAGEKAENSMRGNLQAPLRTLAEETGGFLLVESNNLSKAMDRIGEEICNYYELTYRPNIEKYDGRLRKIKVQVDRKDAVVLARNGYFAMPATSRGAAPLPYELALMKALEATPVSKDVEFRAAAMTVKPGAEAQGLVIVEVPMSGIQFSEHVDSKTFSSRVSLLSLVKDQKGEVVGKVSTDLPRNGPLALLPQARAGNFIYTEPLTLPPGRYTLETAVMDHEAGKVGTRKTSYVVAPPHKGVSMSSLFLVRNFQPNAKEMSPSEPLQYQGGKITATLSGHVYRVKGAQLSTFFVVYPDPSIAEKPVALVEFSVDGKVIAKGQLPLPAADAQGRVPYVMSSPAESMPPATYLIHVTVKQGGSTAEEMAQVQVLEQ